MSALDARIRHWADETKAVRIEESARAEFHRLLYIFGGGFVLLTTMIIGSFLLLENQISTTASKFDDKISPISTPVTRVETKLDDLLQRIPPAPLVPNRR